MSVAAGMPIGTIVRVRQRYTVHCAECDWMRTTRTRSAAVDKVQAHAAAQRDRTLELRTRRYESLREQLANENSRASLAEGELRAAWKALAEAQATIERVRAICRNYSYSGLRYALENAQDGPLSAPSSTGGETDA